MKKLILALVAAFWLVGAQAQCAEAADQLFDYAEGRFPTLLPGHKTTRTLSPFLYRYYPETGIYVGVVNSFNASFQYGGVYVLGGPFAGIVYVGQNTNFITPSCPTQPTNGCYDYTKLYATTGTRIVTAMRLTAGTATGTYNYDTTTGSMTTFQGFAAYEVTQKRTSSGGTNATDKSYVALSSVGEPIFYGSTTTDNNTGASSTIAISPPWTDHAGILALGESYTATFNFSSGGRTTQSGVTRKYAARETITVPAGTFNTCRFEESAFGVATGTQWVIVGKGVVVKTSSSSGAIQEATSVTINGAAP